MADEHHTQDGQQPIDSEAPRTSQRVDVATEIYELYGGKPPHQAGSDTSESAADAIKPTAATLRSRVFEAIKSSGRYGLTDEEMQIGLGMNPNTQRPRRRELVMKGMVSDSGHRRPTRTGRDAVVWATAFLHPIDRGPHEPANKRLVKAEERIIALEQELAEAKSKAAYWENRYVEEEESCTGVNGMLADLADILFDDPRRAEQHGYEGIEERARALAKGAS